jgi:hypothetical protein
VSYTPLAHVSTGELATAALHNTLLDNVAGLITGLHELYIPIGAFRPHPVNGCAPVEDVLLSSGIYISGMAFDGGTLVESCSFVFAFPKRWNEGTITAQVYTFNTGGGAGNYVFSLAAVCASDDDSLDVAVGTSQTMTDTALVAKDLATSPQSAAITIAGTPSVGDLTRVVLTRDPTVGGDTYASDVYVTGVKLRLTVDASEDA